MSSQLLPHLSLCILRRLLSFANLITFAICLGLTLSPLHGQDRLATSVDEIVRAAALVDSAFEINAGQDLVPIRFISRQPGFTAKASTGRLTLSTASAAPIDVLLQGALANANPQSQDELRPKKAFLLGRDRSRWLRNVTLFRRIHFSDQQSQSVVSFDTGDDGLSIIFDGLPGQFPVLRFAGADSVTVDPDGSLRITNSSIAFVVSRPSLEGGGSSQAGFRVLGDGRVELVASTPLPTSTRIQASAQIRLPDAPEESFSAITSLDEAVYLARSVPYLSDAAKTAPIDAGQSVTAIFRFSAAPQHVVGITYVGGTGQASINAMAVTPDGELFAAGHTNALDFPVTDGVLQDTLGGREDAFIVRMTPKVDDLIYSTLFGGAGTDIALGIAVTDDHAAYIAGFTDSPNLSGSTQGVRNDGDAFVLNLRADGSSATYVKRLGGSALQVARGIAINSRGEAWVTGYTASKDFPVTNDAYQKDAHRGFDAFVVHLNRTGDLLYGTFLGGSDDDVAYSIVLESDDIPIIAGTSQSHDFVGYADDHQESSLFFTRLAPGEAPTTTLLYDTRLNAVSAGFVMVGRGGANRMVFRGVREESIWAEVLPIPHLTGPRNPVARVHNHILTDTNVMNADSINTAASTCPVSLTSNPPAEPGPADNDTCMIDFDGAPIMGPRGARRPLILIDGINGNKTDLSQLDTSYFSNLIAYLNDKHVSDAFKIYTFHWASNVHRGSEIGQSLRNWIDFYRKKDPNFDINPIVFIAHSTGGLIAREYLNQRDNDAGSPAVIHKRGGESVARLITLATPHYGSPLANSTNARLHGGFHLWWKALLDAVDEGMWSFVGKCEPCDSDTTHPNRGDLRWASYSTATDVFRNDDPQLYALNPAEVNTWLKYDIQKTYDHLISAYYGEIGNLPLQAYRDDDPSFMLYLLGVAQGSKHIHLLDPQNADWATFYIGGATLERVYYDEFGFGETVAYAHNDGVVVGVTSFL